MTTTIRIGSSCDYDAVARVMYEAVRSGRSRYSQAQREAWVPEIRSGPDWTERLGAQTLIVAEQESVVVGFMTLTEPGYVDLAFIVPDCQGTGLFRRMYNRLENVALESAVTRLSVHASLMAQSAFSAMGFTILKEETVELRGQSFRRFEMEKFL